MRGDNMIFFKKKPKYLVFDNKTDFITIKIKQIVYIKTDFKNDYFFEIHLINGSAIQFDCGSKEVRAKICEAIRNILI